MTAPLYLLDGVALGRPGDQLVLDGAEGHHAGTVRRTRVGERVDVADGLGAVARCVVTGVVIGSGRLELAVKLVERIPEPRPRLVLVQALAKGGRDELAVETATELGVDEVVPWQAARSVVVWSGERGRRSHARWVNTVRSAAKQSRRAHVPQVHEPVTTVGVVDRIGQVVAGGGLVLVLDAAASTALADVQVPPESAVVLVVVGPEGGLDDAELAQVAHAGACAVRLGPHVLRSSSAGAAALAVLSVRLGRWR